MTNVLHAGRPHMKYLFADRPLSALRPELTLEEIHSGPLMVRTDSLQDIPLPSASIDVVVTSPPYLAQRTYGTEDAHEIGGEQTVDAYLCKLVRVFEQLRRVMKPGTSTLWLNIGDKANNSGGAGGDWSAPGGPARFRDRFYADGTFVDVPGQVVHELLRREWRLRLPIVWDKGREAPESLRHTRRPRWSHEMIYMLTPWPKKNGRNATRQKWYPSQLVETGSVWHFPPGSHAETSHLAPFPDELARRCILATTLPGDVVLDPFAGSGTVPRVAAELGRHGIGLDLYAGRPDLVHGTTESTEYPT